MQEEVRNHQRKLLEALHAKTEPYLVEVRGIPMTVNPNVFPPTTDTRLLADYVRAWPGCRFCDLTTGCGGLAVIAGLQGATGFAGDINPDAVKCAGANFDRFGINFIALESDLFSNIPLEEFDLIVANGPYIEGEVTEPLEHSFFGAKRYVTTLFRDLRFYLKKRERLLITFAEWGELEFFEETARVAAMEYTILARRTSDDGQRVYRLYEVRKRI